MIRFTDWEIRLERAIAARRQTRHQWGFHDCCLAPCGLIEAITGINPADGARYNSRDEALETVEFFGGFREMIGRMAAAVGMDPIGPKSAQRGDFVLVKLGGIFRHRDDQETFTEGLAPGVVALDGRRVLLAGPIGWTECSRNMIIEAWRV